jgi:uncharacterized membrane protein
MGAGNAAPVTRREFYRALALVWTFIMLAFSTSVYTSRSPFPVNVIYLMASVFMVIGYSAASWRGNVSRTRVVLAVILAIGTLAVGAVAYFAGRTAN